MTKATVARKMTVPAAEAWNAIRQIGRLDVWFPAISECSVDGNGIGAIRRMISSRGDTIVDHIIDIQPAKKRLVYDRKESPFPVSSYRGTVEVFDSFDGLAIVVWTVDFESASEESTSITASLEGAIGAGVQGLRADLDASKAV